MSRVASNPSVVYYNGVMTNPLKITQSSVVLSSSNTAPNRGSHIRTKGSTSNHKETVHVCPLCNTEYKDPRVLPCTHTYCFDCIRDKLIKNSRLTCSKCHYQAHPFEENHLRELPRNLILSQEWSIGARPVAPLSGVKKPNPCPSTTPNTKMSTLQITKNSSTPAQTNEVLLSNSTTLAATPTSNVTIEKNPNGAPVVSNLIKIYSDIAASKKPNDNVGGFSTNNELTRIFREASRNDANSKMLPLSTKKVSDNQGDEEEYEEITWENVPYKMPPLPPPLPLDHAPVGFTSEQDTNVKPIRRMISPIHEVPTAMDHSTSENHDLSQRLSGRSNGYDDYMNRSRSSSGGLPRPIQDSLANNEDQQRIEVPVVLLDGPEENESIRRRSISPGPGSSRQSIDRFPPPPTPKQFEATDIHGHESVQFRSPSPASRRSSTRASAAEHTVVEEIKYLDTERFYPNTDRHVPAHTSSSSQVLSISSTPTHRSPSASVENDRSYSRSSQHQQSPSRSSASLTPSVATRVELLLADQKRLEEDIQDHIKRLKYDYDDIRQQINHKQSAIHNEVKNIAAHLDEDINNNFHQKQKIYQDLANDTNILGTELERLRSDPHQSQTNKQQLWENLQQIETNIRAIRQAVDQYKEIPSVLTFAESRRSISSDTLGQITYRDNQFQPRSTTSSSIPSKISSTDFLDPPITNLSPFKYLRIDHLSNLEPEAMAVTENNKKILLGICNKLFILNEHGDTLKTVPVTPSIRGIAVSKKSRTQSIAYVSHDETVSIIDIENGQILDCVKETDSNGDGGTFLPLGIDTDNMRGDVYVCDYRNSCLIKFDEKLEFLTQWRVYNHSEQYDEARPKLISIYGPHLYMIVEHSCKSDYNRGIAYTFSLHICDIQSGSIIKIIDADSLSAQRLRWPCSIQAYSPGKCYILDTMTSGKYFNGQWQKHWSRVIEIDQKETNTLMELFQLDSEASTMAMNKNIMTITANNEILFVNLTMIQNENSSQR